MLTALVVFAVPIIAILPSAKLLSQKRKYAMRAMKLVLAPLLSVFVAGCVSTDLPAPVQPNQQTLFQPRPDRTKLFVFAYDESAITVPWLGQHFGVTINGNYAGSFSGQQYAEFDLVPGRYAFNAIKYGWTGAALLQASFDATIPASNGIGCLAAVTHVDASMTLSVVKNDFCAAMLARRTLAQNPVDYSAFLGPR